MTWTGATDAIWRNNYGNWSGNAPTFLADDTVLFDSAADSANVPNRNIAVDSGGVFVSDMTFTGNGNYTFTGGPIYGRTTVTTFADATGRLTMNGTGLVTLANDEATNFTGGIAINTGTLAGAAIALGTNSIVVAAPATLVLDQGDGGSFGNFGGVVTGAGAVTKTGDATIGLATTATIATATLNIDGGALSSNHAVINVTTLNVNPAGTLQLDGGGSLTATTLNLNDGGAILVNAPVTITANTFNHAGALYIGHAANAINPVGSLTINGNYNGQNGTLGVSTILSAPNPVADTLVVNGNAAGAALLDVSHPASEAGIPTTGQGILVATINGSNNLDLKLAHQVNAGLYDYNIFNDNGSYYLRSNLSSAIMTANAAPAIAELAGRASLDTTQQRLGELRFDPDHSAGLWVRGSYREDKLQKGWLNGINVDTTVFQVGADRAFVNPNGTPDNWILGAYYAHTEAKGKMNDGFGSLDTNRSDGGGLYVVFKRGPFYIEALGKADFLHAALATTYSNRTVDGTIIGGSLEAGYEFPLNATFGTLEAQAQVAYQYVKLNNSFDNQIPRYTFDHVPAPTPRLGARWHNEYRLGKTSLVTPWLRASWAYDAKATYRTTVADTIGQTHLFDNSLRGSRLIFDAGATLQIAARWSVYAGLAYETAVRTESWSASAGIRYAW